MGRRPRAGAGLQWLLHTTLALVNFYLRSCLERGLLFSMSLKIPDLKTYGGVWGGARYVGG